MSEDTAVGGVGLARAFLSARHPGLPWLHRAYAHRGMSCPHLSSPPEPVPGRVAVVPLAGRAGGKHDERMAELMDDTQIRKALAQLPDWRLEGAALVRTVELPSFSDAIRVVNRVAEIAENDNHHPDIDIRWRTLVFRCSTHAKGGITEADVSLAEEIDGVLDALS